MSTAVFLKASFVKKTLYNSFNGELKSHTTEQTLLSFNIAVPVGSVNTLLECQPHNEIKLAHNTHQTL